MAESCYVYSILPRDASLPPGLVGFRGAALTVVPWRSLAAATSVLDAADLRPTPENLLRHETVVESLRLVGPVLPVRFGTILADQSAVVRALADRHAVLLSDLARLGDKVELGLSVLWDPEGWCGKESGKQHGGEFSDRQASLASPGARYLMGRLAQHRKEMLLHSRAQAIAQRLDDVLRHHALEIQHVLLATSRLMLRGAYLLECSQIGAFREAFEELRKACPRLRFLLSGPWPPYSFVTPPDTSPSALLDRLGASALASALR